MGKSQGRKNSHLLSPGWDAADGTDVPWSLGAWPRPQRGPCCCPPTSSATLGDSFSRAPARASLGSSSSSLLSPLGLSLPSATGLSSSPSLSSQVWGPAPDYPSAFIRGWFLHISVCHRHAPAPGSLPGPSPPCLLHPSGTSLLPFLRGAGLRSASSCSLWGLTHPRPRGLWCPGVPSPGCQCRSPATSQQGCSRRARPLVPICFWPRERDVALPE